MRIAHTHIINFYQNDFHTFTHMSIFYYHYYLFVCTFCDSATKE